MDPLSEVLSLLKPRTYMAGGLDIRGKWSIEFRHEPTSDARHIKCCSVVSGACWLTMDGVAEPLRLEAGDAVLVTGGRTFRLASDLHAPVPVVDFLTLITAPLDGRVVSHNGGGEFFAVGSYFTFPGDHANMLLRLLPPIVHIDGELEKAALRLSLEQMNQELRKPQPGGVLLVQYLAYMMLVQALRLHLADGAKGGVGWLFALADRQIGPVINAMHDAPARRWTLQDLAQLAGMSRSTFALKFKAAVGESAMEYLLHWRMLLAAEKVAKASDPISKIAYSLGYESESAFSAAFKRIMGCSPRQYARSLSRA
jgi:AraC-like DNA-binding protein